MVYPLEQLLHIVCQLSLMGKPLFQVPLKHVADACAKSLCQFGLNIGMEVR